MKNYILTIPLILAFIGCSAVQENVKKEENLVYYVEPPLEFNKAPTKDVIAIVFTKAGAPFSIEEPDYYNFGNVTFKLTEKIELDILLKVILEQNRLTFAKDSGGVYHIKKAFSYVEAPLEFKDTPIKEALETVFSKAGNIPFSLEVTEIEKVEPVNLRCVEKHPLEEILGLILEIKGLTFEKDKDGKYHIKRRVHNDYDHIH